MLSKLLAPSDEQVTLTPWGAPQHITKLAESIQSVSTASHGGIRLSNERNEQIPEYIRNADGWDQQIFQREHANSLIVVSAYGSWASWVPKGFVGCHAYVGGRGERGQT